MKSESAVDLPGSESAGDQILRFRSIWISDIHLGTRGCQAERLLDFLRHTESDYLYLVGDIVDGWAIRRRWYWPQAHNDVIQKILRRARHGAKVIYVPGNHDEAARPYCGLHFGGVYVVNEAIHETADGRRILVLHGDQFDAIVGYAKWLAHLGDKAYDLALFVNRVFNAARKRLGMPYWSLSAFLKHKVKNAVEHISAFETFIAERARHDKADAVLCGHIHHAEMRQIGDILYLNDGDWVESCTALVEDFNGKLSIIRWAEEREKFLYPPIDKMQLNPF
jgi:UDP-2,3-diacylglucosamine pyrophosphatase LpxH